MTFRKSLTFAAAAAVISIPWLVLVTPLLGPGASLSLLLVMVTAAYLATLAPNRRWKVGIVVGTLAAGLLVAAFTRTTGETALGLAAFLAVARSGFLYRRSGARAVVTEAILICGGLLFARHLAARSLIGVALPIWGFFLVQSLYVLVGGWRFRRPRANRDPFEEAHTRAVALLDP